MTPESCKKLLEMGILQAYAEGETIEVYDSHSNTWYPYNEPNDHPWFDRSPNHYRIKPEPQFEVGDLVRTPDGTICKVMIADSVARLSNLKAPHLQYAEQLSSLTKVHEVRTPFTFEDAIKACAEHGMKVKYDNFENTITEIDHESIRVGNKYLYYWKECLETVFTSDNTPFCNISYEPITN